MSAECSAAPPPSSNHCQGYSLSGVTPSEFPPLLGSNALLFPHLFTERKGAEEKILRATMTEPTSKNQGFKKCRSATISIDGFSFTIGKILFVTVCCAFVCVCVCVCMREREREREREIKVLLLCCLTNYCLTPNPNPN